MEYDLMIEQARKTGKLQAMVEILLRELRAADSDNRTIAFVEKQLEELTNG